MRREMWDEKKWEGEGGREKRKERERTWKD